MDVQIMHLGTSKNGTFRPYKPELLKSDYLQYDDQPCYIAIYPYVEAKSKDQLGYLHGGIIRGTCMKTEYYGGWTAKEIYNDFCQRFAEETVYKERGGLIYELKVRDSIKDYSKKRMAEFITDILNFLAMEDIHPLSPEEYIIGKYKTVKEK